MVIDHQYCGRRGLTFVSHSNDPLRTGSSSPECISRAGGSLARPDARRAGSNAALSIPRPRDVQPPGVSSRGGLAQGAPIGKLATFVGVLSVMAAGARIDDGARNNHGSAATVLLKDGGTNTPS